LRERFLGADRGRVSTKSTPTDLVSESDIAAEALIRSRLAEARPDDGVVGEEGDDLAGASDRRWVVDPLDGTINFLFGIPQWAVSIAVENGDGALAAVVYDPNRDEVWSAVRGGSPLLDGEPVEPSLREDLATSLIATGFGYDAGVRAQQGELVAKLLPHVRDIRRLGSAALDLCWTACGRYDAYFERGVKHWDVAAGALLCECAGLVVRRLEPSPPAEAGVLVAAPGLIDTLAPYVV
jgi:myo-inositol-1(or 4)-monophosphatase